MLRMIRFELKKIYSNSVVIGSLAVLLLICFLILQAYCFNNLATSTITPDGTKLSGREAITFNQSIANKYVGDFTDDTIARMVVDFSIDYPEEYGEMAENGAVNALIPSSYLYLSMFIPPADYDEVAEDAIAHGISIPDLTEYGLVSIQDYGTAYVDKPLQYGYNDSWAYFFSGFCGSTIAIAFPALIVIVIAISTIFSNEYSTKMAALILTTRYGRNRLIIAKLLAGMIFTTMIIIGLFVLFSIAFGTQYGLAGWDADIQANLQLSFIALNIPLNNLQLIFLGMIIVWIAGISTAAVTALISTIMKSPFSALILAFALYMAPWIIRQILAKDGLYNILLIFPVNAINVHELLLQSNTYQHPWFLLVTVIFLSGIVTFLTSAITYKWFGNSEKI